MLTMKDIRREGDPILTEQAKEIELPATEEEKQILRDMQQFLINSQDPETAIKYELRSGIGIAAPQIGVGKRMIAVHVTDQKGTLYSYGLMNPKIISHSVEKTFLDGGEGCLSVDREVPGAVPRFARITVKGIDAEGEAVKVRLKGLPSIVVQHEIDHLDGIMFYDRINNEEASELSPLNR
ncbi:peptide deformylase [Pseudalkalibacillus hwajinpoensis]|uniref:Peptide deformylase n=1 Tax=Guptibacillus hwajinpoensis TaxID=208199 RepID=A0A4U1MMY2_9BACL|nr:peptide deformylase [Pseudalkalibacillus hwajinpoensis]TKD71820.1 peptide deformylase [Pseudalkalibacillus hwajinpoensis]